MMMDLFPVNVHYRRDYHEEKVFVEKVVEQYGKISETCLLLNKEKEKRGKTEHTFIHSVSE